MTPAALLLVSLLSMLLEEKLNLVCAVAAALASMEVPGVVEVTGVEVRIALGLETAEGEAEETAEDDADTDAEAAALDLISRM